MPPQDHIFITSVWKQSVAAPISVHQTPVFKMVAKLLLQLLSHTTLEECGQGPSISLFVTIIS